MIVNIGHRRTKINHTYAHIKNSLELLALLLPMMMLLVCLSAMLMCVRVGEEKTMMVMMKKKENKCEVAIINSSHHCMAD
jgi:hypothetical protein